MELQIDPFLINFRDIDSQDSLSDSEDLSSLPSPHVHDAFACNYCENVNTSSLVQCGDCQRWFCNSRSQTTASHIICHLLQSNHKTIALHEKNEFGDTEFECHECGCKNIFVLGMVVSADNNAMLICREPCLTNLSKEDNDIWDVDEWTPLVRDKSILDDLAYIPTRDETKNFRKFTIKEAKRLEEIWKENPEASMDDVTEVNEEDIEVSELPVQFESADQYVEIFHSLVCMEEAYSRKVKEGQILRNVHINWIDNAYRASFKHKKFEFEFRLLLGDELILEQPSINWKEHCFITKISHEEIFVTFSPQDLPRHIVEDFTIKPVWNDVTFKRMKSALNAVKKSPLLNVILGKEVPSKSSVSVHPKTLQAPNLPSLNPSQLDAISTVLQRNFSIIQGPPGTGKTVTSSTIVYHMSRHLPNSRSKILVCASSNIAVDQLTEKIALTGLSVTRVCARSRESIETSLSEEALHMKLRKWNGSHANRFRELQSKEPHDLTEAEYREYIKVKNSIEMSILEKSDVICCTCIGAGDHRFRKFNFRFVLIDECTQALEPECLVPLAHGAEHVVLVGDHCQLGPVVTCKRAQSKGFTRSLFERIVSLGHKPIRLQVQYRMHPVLSQYPSNTFYEGSLHNGVSESDRAFELFNWPKKGVPMLFYHSSGTEELSVSGISYLNRGEAVIIEKIVTHLIKKGARPEDIGIITPYEGQRSFILNYMESVGVLSNEQYQAVEIASVDSFQGREKEIIILSCVRSNQLLGVGFLKDARRLNVAITRAKRALFVIGNAKLLSTDTLWNGFLKHFKKQGVIVEGSFPSLRTSNVTLSQPRQKSKKARAALSTTNQPAEASNHWIDDDLHSQVDDSEI